MARRIGPGGDYARPAQDLPQAGPLVATIQSVSLASRDGVHCAVVSPPLTMPNQFRQSADEPITSLLSIDQRYFLSSCEKGSIKVWDSQTNQISCNKLNAHSMRVNSLKLLSKFRVVSCSKDKQARVWQLQGNTIQKSAEMTHNSSVVSSIELNHKDWIVTITQQGYVYVWDLLSLAKPVNLYKFDSDRVINSGSFLDYDFELFPFIWSHTQEGEIEIIQVTTGKSRKLKFHQPIPKGHHKSSSLLVQTDSQHLVACGDSGRSIRLLSVEFENIKDAILNQ